MQNDCINIDLFLVIRKHPDWASCGEALDPGVFHMLRGKLTFDLSFVGVQSQSSRTSKNKNKQQDFKKMRCFPSRRLYQLKTCVVCRSPGLIELLERKMTSEQTSQVSTFQNFGCSIKPESRSASLQFTSSRR